MTSGNSEAEGLRGFGPRGIFAILAITLANVVPFIPLSAILVLFWRSFPTPPTFYCPIRTLLRAQLRRRNSAIGSSAK